MKSLRLSAVLALLLTHCLSSLAVAQEGQCTKNGTSISCSADTGGSYTILVGSSAVYKGEAGLAGVGTIASGLTAAGTTYTDGLALTANHNVVTTVAAGTGVILPACKIGPTLKVTVYNRGANALSVYPFLGGTISLQSVNVAVTVAPGRTAEFACGTAANTWYSNYPSPTLGEAQSMNLADATPVAMTSVNAVVTAAPTAGTGVVTLPTCQLGTSFRVFNRIGTGAAVTVKPPSGAQIDAAGTDTAVSLANAKGIIYFCYSATQIYTVKGA